MKSKVYNDNIVAKFNLSVKNSFSLKQDFEILPFEKKGWDLVVNPEKFSLEKGEEKLVNLVFRANSDFDYTSDVLSPNEIKISQIKDYKGYFTFPIQISGIEENVTVNFEVEVDKKEKPPIIYGIEFSNNHLSPISPLAYTVNVENLDKEQEVEIRVELEDMILNSFKDSFSGDINFKIFQSDISGKIVPGEYNGKVTVRVPIEGSNMVSEWSLDQLFIVDEYKNLIVNESFQKSFYRDVFKINLNNEGNIVSNFEKEFELSFFQKIFVKGEDFEKTEKGIYFNKNIQRGEKLQLEYEINYISLYVLFLVIIFLIVYVYVRMQENPLFMETEVYSIKKDSHEGIKSFKVKIGFENIKEFEIETIKLVFNMPSFLNVKDSSFLLSEPNQVLKGGNKYKLIWNFKKFGDSDSRVLGFTLENKKGVLGDIRLPRLEIHVKVDGKTRKYWKSFPLVRG